MISGSTQRVTHYDPLGPIKMAQKVFRIRVAPSRNQTCGERNDQGIHIKWIRTQNSTVFRDCINSDFSGSTAMLGGDVDVVQRVGRTQFAPFAVERMPIADKLGKLVEYLHILVVGPYLFIGCKALELLRLTK